MSTNNIFWRKIKPTEFKNNELDIKAQIDKILLKRAKVISSEIKNNVYYAAMNLT